MKTSIEEQIWQSLARQEFNKLHELLADLQETECKILPLGMTPLHLMAHFNDAQGLSILLTKQANPNAVGRKGYTPLHSAAQKGNIEIIRALLDDQLSQKARIEARDVSGATPLHHAVLCGQMLTVDTLLELGAQLQSIDTSDNTVLHKAAAVGNVAMIKHLIDLGLSVNTKNASDWTALDVLKKYGHEALIGEVKEYANLHGPEPVVGTRVFEHKIQSNGIANLLSKFSGAFSKLGFSSCYKSGAKTDQEEGQSEVYIAMETYANGGQ